MNIALAGINKSLLGRYRNCLQRIYTGQCFAKNGTAKAREATLE
jgi:hypothetical protein